MDGISLASVASELRAALTGAKIEKIYQPERDELTLAMRAGQKLLLSAHPSHCRAQLTQANRTNPSQPPMFCMLLRKHLTGGRIVGVSQPNFERILRIEISALDEMGYETTFALIAELMGKHSNIILTREDGVIVDAIKHITPAISSVRNVMPGLKYSPPPVQGKLNPLEFCEQGDVFSALEGKGGRLDKLIGSTWSGISPPCALEIALRCGELSDSHYETLNIEAMQSVSKNIACFFSMLKSERFAPTLVLDPYGEAIACFAFRPLQYSPDNQRRYDSLCQALDDFYELRDRRERMRQKGSALSRALTNHIERNRKKLSMQREILEQSSKMDEYRLYGELLTANAYRLKKGALSASVENYYDENQAEVNIPMDSALSPSENAQKYFKRYNKLKAAYDMAGGQIAQIESQLDYLEGQLDNLNKCTEEAELREIREELVQQGYIKPEKARQKQPKLAPSKPMRYKSSDGAEIYVGKNNAQNDNLTLRFAEADDIWLHTKNIPGSHVLIKSASPSDATLLEAAHLAAYYSKARSGAQVPVDYTPRKYIKKPGGSPPGFVIYSTNKTIYVTPDESLIKKLEQF